MNHSLYFHIPFCTHRCAYCDFNTYAGQEDLIPAYVEALIREIEVVGESAPERVPVHTIFFGGGTPSLLTPEQFGKILGAIRKHFNLDGAEAESPVSGRKSGMLSRSTIVDGTPKGERGEGLETSLEANPGTVTPASLEGLRQAGFNRISFGVQSAHPDELRQLERIHDFFDVINSVKWARQAGFENLNLDLIYGLPEQTLQRWQESVRRAVDLGPEHLSLYALTIEHGTPFGRWMAQGLMPLPNPDLAADMYEWVSDYLKEQGYEQYEISNWAKPGFQCRHNLQYWRNQPYVGFGAGAHGSAGGLRISNVLRIKTYIERFSSEENQRTRTDFPLSLATVNQVKIDRFTEMQETMMLGLRLTNEGVAANSFRERFGEDMTVAFGKEIEALMDLGLLQWDGSGTVERIHLTERGRLLGNQVFMRFVGDD